MNKESFLFGVSLTCLITMLFAPIIVSDKDPTLVKTIWKRDTLNVLCKMTCLPKTESNTPNFQLEAHQIKSSLNKSKLKHSVCIKFGISDPSGILDSSASLNKSKSKGCVGDLRITVI